MSDTYKRKAWIFRTPRGRKNALINGARKRAVPPSAWDDIHVDHAASRLPMKIAKKLKKRGFSEEEAIKKIMKKFNYSRLEAEETVIRQYREWTG